MLPLPFLQQECSELGTGKRLMSTKTAKLVNQEQVLLEGQC